MKLYLDGRDRTTCKYYTVRKCSPNKPVTDEAHPLDDLEGSRMAAGVSPYSVPVGIPLPQMPVVVDVAAIPNKETRALA